VLDYRTFRLAAVHELITVGHEWKVVLWGELAGMPAADLLNILSHGNRSGILLVHGEDDSERALGLCSGNITWLQKGAFTFLRGAVPPGEGPTVQEVLLDGLRRLDESREMTG